MIKRGNRVVVPAVMAGANANIQLTPHYCDLFILKRVGSRIIRECKMISEGVVLRNNSMRLFIAAGFNASTFRTIIPAYFSGGYRRIFAKSWSRVMMILFSANANEATSESGDDACNTSLTSAALSPRDSITALVERGRLASIRNFKEGLLSLKSYFFFLGEHRRIINTCPYVVVSNGRVFSLDFIVGHPCGKGIKDDEHGYAGPLETGFPMTNGRINGYSFKQHSLSILDFYG